jgi:ABC-type uncharacterized transport system permease subunit
MKNIKILGVIVLVIVTLVSCLFITVISKTRDTNTAMYLISLIVLSDALATFLLTRLFNKKAKEVA